MGFIRIAFKLIRLVSVGYTLWRAYRSGKRFVFITGLWRLLRGKPALGIRKPEMVIVGSADPRIYKRRGWRKYQLRAIRKL